MSLPFCFNISPGFSKISFGLIFLLFNITLFPYNIIKIDSLNRKLASATHDTERVKLMNELGKQYRIEGQPDSSLAINKRALSLARQTGYKKGIAMCLNSIGVAYYSKGDLTSALHYYIDAFKINEEIKDRFGIGKAHNNIGLIYLDMQEYDRALDNFQKAVVFFREVSDEINVAATLTNIASIYKMKQNLDSALAGYFEALRILEGQTSYYQLVSVLDNIANVLLLKDDYSAAIKYASRALKLIDKFNIETGRSSILVFLAQCYQKLGDLDKSIAYAKQALHCAQETEAIEDVYFSADRLYTVFKQRGDYANALKYLEISRAAKDSIFTDQKKKELQGIHYAFEIEKKQKEIKLLEKEKELSEESSRNQHMFLVTFVIAFILAGSLAGVIFRGYRNENRIHIRLEEQIKERTAELEKAKLKAEESDRLKSTLLANMSHEFRTPLNGILGSANILIEQAEDPLTHRLCTGIVNSSMRLFITLEDILTITELEGKAYTIKSEPVDLSSEIEELSRKLYHSINPKNVTLHFSCDEKIVVDANHELIRKAFKKIIDNAFKYTHQGAVTISIKSEDVSGVKYAVIRINDTGIGINTEDYQKIFEPFRQISEGFGRSYEGSGLGLPIAKRIIEMSGGTIHVESTPGKGSDFYIRLPISDVPEVALCRVTGEVIPPLDSVIKRFGGKPCLLLIEDNEPNIMFVEILLSEYFDFDHARNGVDAIAKIKQKQYHLILIDINLGTGIDGIETRRRIIEIEAYKNIPIAAMTGYTLTAEREDILDSGFQFFIAKPFKKEKLLRLVAEMLDTHIKDKT
ncbi:MAG: tetratricopeptide repeat protein [Ignavibacteriales bacterium]|nr:tetratricopeptide repeat protein [Ignavibacteriales bacterium]